MDDGRERMYGDHYGPYGIACVYTGQFDAGVCWKCQIRKLKEKLAEVTEQVDVVAEAMEEVKDA